MLKQRVITALILGAIFIGSILFADTAWLSLLLAVVLFAAAREMLTLTVAATAVATAVISVLFALLFWASLALVNPFIIYWQSLVGAALWIMISIGFPFYRHQVSRPLWRRLMMLGIGLVALWICAHSLIYLHAAYGGWILLYMLTLVWLADIGAYFVGRRFGKHKLAPSISPGKTWEGVFGGILVNLLWMLTLYWLTYLLDVGLLTFLLIGISTVLISISGDLFESILKRDAGVKDSSNLLPGHGGILDRIDSVIAASPVFVSGLIIAAST